MSQNTTVTPRTFDELQALNRLRKLAEQIARIKDLHSAFVTTLDTVIDLVSADLGTVHSWDETRQEWRIAARRGPAMAGGTSEQLWLVPEVAIAQAAATRASTSFDAQRFATFAASGFRTAHCIPVPGPFGSIAAVMTFYFSAACVFGERELKWLETFGCQAMHLIERSRVETAINESEARFRTIFEESNDFIFTADLDQRVTSCNPATAAALEMRIEDIIGHSIAEFAHKENFERTSAMLALKLRQGGSTRYEAEVVSRHGKRMTWEINSRLTFDAEGRPTGAQAIARDITAMHEAHEALRKSEGRFRSAVNAVRGIVYTTNPEGRMEGDQPGWSALTGQTPAEYQGFGWTTAVHPDDLPNTVETWRRTLRERASVFMSEHRVRRRDGQWRLYSVRGVPIMGEHERADEWVGVLTDITEQKLGEQALRDADRRKDEFLAMLAHELRNPLAPIRTAAQILKLTTADLPQLRQASVIIERQVEHMTEIVNDLLDVSRVTRGLITLDLKPTVVQEVVTLAVEQSRPLVESRRHRLTIEMPTEPVVLSADSVRLVQVVGNLINNAAKHSGTSGHIDLRVVLAPQVVEIRIRDDGLGISPDLLPRVFDLFTQADRSEARSEGGLGIGLALVRRLVELHGGRVEAFSGGASQGAEFVVSLPRTASSSERATLTPLHSEAAKSAALRVLLVDDNRDAADMMAMMLRMDGHEVFVEYSSHAALQRATVVRPDVMLLDIGLPEMNGYELARRLRADPDTRSATLIAVTGYGQDEDRRRAREAGFDHHLMKPVDSQAVKELLMKRASG